MRELPDSARWNDALHQASLVVAHASVLTNGIREHANVVFPADSYAEKEGTVVHPDGRLQRLRTAIAHPGSVRAGWSVIAEISKRAGLDQRVLTSSMAFRQLVDAVPFYAGLTLEEIGGRGVRWPARAQASAMPPGATVTPQPPSAPIGRSVDGALRVGIYRPIWAAPEVEISPALHFAIARQQVELSPEDAQRLGIANGETVQVAQLDDSGAAESGEAGGREPDDSRAARYGEAGGRAGGRREGRPEGTRLEATAAVRTGVPAGAAFLADGIENDSANALTEATVEVIKAR